MILACTTVRRTALVGAALLAGCRPSETGQARPTAQSPRDAARALLIARVDSLVESFRTSHHIPGLSVAAVRGTDTLVLRGAGLADVEDSTPATAQTVYRIGSITKQFTAAAVLRLVEQGKIRLDAPISTYLSSFPAPGRRATIQQLLTHTSGIPSYTDLPTFRETMQLDLTDDELLSLVDRRPLDFPSGTQWHYDNSGYYILGVILERLTGTPYGAYIERSLTKPLGLTATRYCSLRPIIPHRASGYSRHDDTTVNAAPISMNLPGAAGALCSTVGDLLRWQHALAAGNVVSPATYRAMTTPAILPNGVSTHYGYALGVYTLHGHDVVEHSGGINGFSTDLLTFPGDSVTVVVLFNTDAADAALLARQIGEMVLAIPDSGATSLPLTAAERERYVGHYVAHGSAREITAQGDRLMLRGGRSVPLRYQGQDRFTLENDHDVQLQFHGAGARASGFSLTPPGSMEEVYTRGP